MGTDERGGMDKERGDPINESGKMSCENRNEPTSVIMVGWLMPVVRWNKEG